ncbi:MAG TPA: PaaI family thioesterase [Acidimicrobiales bacterium]|nr:PaaI family thioesterase [Acidimicrobiales bacterium]
MSDGAGDGAGTEPGGNKELELLAAAIRRISAVAVGRPVAAGVLRQAATQLTQVADTLEEQAEDKKRPRRQPVASGEPRDLFPTSPIIGLANPIAPPAQLWAVEGEDGQREIRGQVTFDYPYEGPPTCVHGGVIAELFDEMLGAANIIANHASMTGTLTIRYRRTTPLLAPLDLVARCTGTERRKVFTWGGIYHDGELTAEADGIFIAMEPGRMLKIVTDNAREATAPVVDADFIELVAEQTKG